MPFYTTHWKCVKNNIVKLYMQKRGGEPIASGGYGCVFKPALKCKSSDKVYDGVSKLMKKVHAEEEMNVVRNIAEIKTIPNYKDFFVIDGMKICEPDELNERDLRNFDEVCTNLTDDSDNSEQGAYNAYSVNNQLESLNVIQLPDAGKETSDIMSERHFGEKELYEFNENMIKLIEGAVIPMNEKGIYHGDLKDSNILYGHDNKLRIIDWGMSFKLPDKYTKFLLDTISRRRIQFNMPLQNVLFDQYVLGELKRLSKEGASDANIGERIKTLYETSYSYNRGHTKYIEKYIVTILNDPKIQSVHAFFVDYLTKIVLNHKNGNELNTKAFFAEYVNILDIWGAMSIYLAVAKKITSDDVYIKDKNVILEEIVNMLNRFLYRYPHFYTNETERANYKSDVVKGIKHLNTFLLKPTISKVPLEVVNKSKDSKSDFTTESDLIKLLTPIQITKKPKSKSIEKKVTKKKRSKRCPNGTRMNKKTGKCEPLKRKNHTKRRSRTSTLLSKRVITN